MTLWSDLYRALSSTIKAPSAHFPSSVSSSKSTFSQRQTAKMTAKDFVEVSPVAFRRRCTNNSRYHRHTESLIRRKSQNTRSSSSPRRTALTARQRKSTLQTITLRRPWKSSSAYYTPCPFPFFCLSTNYDDISIDLVEQVGRVRY